MPTLISHSVIAVTAGAALAPERVPVRFWLCSIACSCLPDADVIGFSYDIPYGHFIGHRGFFHSPFFGVLLGISVAALFFRSVPIRSKRFWYFALYFSLLAASHGVLDAFTDGGLGIALLAPFENSRYFFPWRPLKVAPIGLGGLFHPHILKVFLSEILWVWLPCLLAAFVIIRIRKNRKAVRNEMES